MKTRLGDDAPYRRACGLKIGLNILCRRPTISIMALEPKAALRKHIRATCRALSDAAVESSSRSACARALPLIASAKAISVYLAMPKGELSTSALLASLFESSGKRVFVPRVEGGSRHDMRMLHVADAAQLDSCAFRVQPCAPCSLPCLERFMPPCDTHFSSSSWHPWHSPAE